ncbi:DUF839 domain-containing protein, partial [Micromonospora sp. DH15]|nr:DUF839 domain-containing protein [Micromonospora sp. DH15]
MSDRPRLLPLLGATRHGSRDAMTCLYRCGNACDHPVPNTSDNPYLGDIVDAEVSRRGVVRAGAVGALVLGFGGAAAGALAGAGAASAAPADPVVPEAAGFGRPAGGVGSGALTFRPIPPNKLDTLVVPNGYDHSVVIRWGDPVVPGTPGFDVHAQTAGVPRDVDRLVRALSAAPDPTPPAAPGLLLGSAAPGPGGAASPGEPPQSALVEFGPDLDRLTPDARSLLLALAAGVPLTVDLLGALLDRTPGAVAELVAATRAAGLLTADHRITPLVRRAVVALSPPTDRTAVWHRLVDQRLGRGGPVLPLVSALRTVGALGDCPAPALRMAAEEALAEQPALAAELFAAATATGSSALGRQAVAALLAGDLAEAAAVAATALAHRGQTGRSVELYRWSGTPAAAAFAEVGSLATATPPGDAGSVGPATGGPPTLGAGAARLMAEGVRASIDGTPTTALSTLVQAAALLEPDGRTVLRPDSPAALAALTGVHCGELDIAERVLDRATASGIGGPLLARRHLLLRAWILMLRGRTAAAADAAAVATASGGLLESRDLLFATTLELGVARRNSDLGALQRGWGHALD